jgi:hypothetical protein
MESKPFYLSKTFWFNILTALAAIAAMPEITTIIPAEFLKYIVALNVIGNIILRVFSTPTTLTVK